jgi:ERCC4-related helicase
MDFDDIPAELLLDALEKAEDMVETMVEPDHETDRPMDQPSHHKLDRLAYQTWIYPTNCSERLYQLNMVQSALFHNTLVALPTGLGKTFIGAVVMFNYFQWFPESKIIFMAPTKPLVAQQIDACYNITGIPPEVTCELTGSTSAELRSQIWAQKRVFYVTPQILQNDLSSGLCPANNISLLVIDEAHRATGNYAYCQLIKELVNRGAIFRVLALTATPGSDAKSVQSVLDNILCEKIEIRTEDSMDIQPFIFKRAIQEVIVPSSDFINELTTKFSKSIEPFLKRLCAAKAFTSHDPLAVSSYYLITQRNRWRTTSTLSGPQKGAIEGDFVVAIALSRCLGLLQSHGIRTFCKNLSAFIEEIKASPKISTAKTKIINDPNIQTLMAQINSQSTLNSFVSHPKHEKLVSIILEHFLESADQKEVDTKVMIFTQYRDSVEEIVSILSEHNPMVRVMSFIGQSSSKKGSGKGLTQKEQLKVIRDFQNGNFNVLVSTSIGEEGLDIGEIDLIICFDSQASPIRMLQRMGRTGRKRKGKIVLLLSKGNLV